MLSSGFSGFSVTHCDVGGYNTVVSNIPGFKMFRSKELLLRWMELGAFTAVFRTSEGIIPSLNSQFYDNDGKKKIKSMPFKQINNVCCC